MSPWVALGLATVALISGCGKYDYQLGSAPSNGGMAGNTAALGGSATTGGTAAGGTAAGGTAGNGGVAGADATAGAAGLIGWAATSDCGSRGTTGGDTAPTVRPKTAGELDDALRAVGASVVEVSGKIVLGDIIPPVTADKTLVGVNGAELVGSVRVLNSHNVILRNIRFNGGGVPGNVDALEIDNSTCVWVDHCEFVDGADSNLDIVRGSDLVTVSWSKFSYVVKTDDHRLGSVCGNSNTDTPGKINVTFHHNWWATGLLNNMPSARHGKVHVFNNYFSASGDTYCVAAGYMSKLLVQNNFFDGVNNPIVFLNDEDTAEVVESGNDYSTSSGDHVSRGTSFVPPYPHALESASAAKASVSAQAGIQ